MMQPDQPQIATPGTSTPIMAVVDAHVIERTFEGLARDASNISCGIRRRNWDTLRQEANRF